MPNRKNDEHTKQAVGAVGVAMVAAAAGAVAALLLAPKSGKDTRADIKKHMDKAKESADHKLEDAKHRAQEGAERMRNAFDEAHEETKKEGRGFWGRK